MMLGLSCGLDLIRHRKARFARQAAASMLFTSLIFVMVLFNFSFTLTLHQAQETLPPGGAIIITRDEIRFATPLDKLVWNATQAWMDNATLSLANRLGAAFVVLTVVVSGLTFSHETSKAYASAKRDNEEFHATVGAMYALGARPPTIYSMFMFESGLPYAAGFVLGVLLSHLALVPVLLGGFHVFGLDWVGIDNTIAALFFRRFDYVVAGTASAMLIMWVVSIKSVVLGRGLRKEKLMEAVREATN